MASPKTEPKPPPRCKAILLCERIIAEATTQKVSLIDVFLEVSLPSFPGHSIPMRVFLQLIDGIGRYELTLEIQDLAEQRTIARGAGPRIAFPDRVTPLQLSLPIPGLTLMHPGRYDVIVFADGQEIDRQQFVAVAAGSHGDLT